MKSTGRQTVNGKINEFATLTCTADGHPLPTISWFKNRTELRNIRKYFPSNDASEGFRSDEQQYPGIMQVTSRLIIQDLQSADSGTYTCQAQSSGTPADSSDPYQLLVSEPPPPGTHPHNRHTYTHTHTHNTHTQHTHNTHTHTQAHTHNTHAHTHNTHTTHTHTHIAG